MTIRHPKVNGTSDLVRLTIPPIQCERKFIQDIIDELEQKMQAHAAGLEEITAIDRLVITMLVNLVDIQRVK